MKRASIPAPGISPKVDLAKNYRRLQRLREMVKQAENVRVPSATKLVSPSSRINPQRRHSA
jgi:hypothetical protein